MNKNYLLYNFPKNILTKLFFKKKFSENRFKFQQIIKFLSIFLYIMLPKYNIHQFLQVVKHFMTSKGDDIDPSLKMF